MDLININVAGSQPKSQRSSSEDREVIKREIDYHPNIEDNFQGAATSDGWPIFYLDLA